MIRLHQAELEVAGQPPRTVALPYREYRLVREFSVYRLQQPFDAPAALRAQPLTLAIDTWPDGGRITVNDVEIADLPTSSATQVVRYLRPFAFNIPPGTLREQGNVLRMEWGSRETLVLVPQPHIGARAVLQPQVDRKLFWEHTVVPASNIFATLVGLAMLAVWWQQRSRKPQQDYGLIALSAAGWIVFNTMLQWSPVPAELFVWRRALGIVGIGAFALGMWVSLMRLAGLRWRAFEGLCAAWVALGPLLILGGFVSTGATHLPTAEAVWSVGAALLGVVPLWTLLRAVRIDGQRKVNQDARDSQISQISLDTQTSQSSPVSRLSRYTPHIRPWVLLGFVGVALALAVREALIYVFKDPLGTVYPGLQLLAPLWLATASGVLVQDFVRSLQQAGLERADIGRRLAKREAQLARLHERERQNATAQATTQERQRIMQDMHDGLGSQLVSSLALAESGRLNPAQTAELLRGCIDDLRLAIDTLTEDSVDLALNAGNLRFRMEPRLRAAGLRLRWDMHTLPDTADGSLRLPGTVALPLLRVLQEALANAMKHALAQTLSVRLAVETGVLEMEVSDDGIGFNPHQHAPGKGLASMQKRARSLGASLDVHSSAQGTRVRLRLPLVPEV